MLHARWGERMRQNETCKAVMDGGSVSPVLPRVAGGRLVGPERRRARMDGEQEGDETLM